MLCMVTPKVQIDVDYASYFSTTRTPEQTLLIAVILRAINDMCHKGDDGRTARNFLFSKCKGKWSFLWMCKVLDLDPSQFILRYKRA